MSRCSTGSGEDLGPDYNDHGVLFCWPDGRPPHPRHVDPTVQSSSSLAWCWLLSLSGVASWVLLPGVVLIGVSALILVL